MIDLKDVEGIYLYKGTTDMRIGMFGLAALAQSIIPIEDMRHRLFVFCSKANNMQVFNEFINIITTYLFKT